jgi:FixJ family two-component response regulator
VDDDVDVCESLGRLFESASLLSQAYLRGADFLEAYDGAASSCLVLDIRMPGMSGISLQEQLLEKGRAIPIIIVTGHGNVMMAVNAMKRGAVEFFEKPVPTEALLDCVQKALAKDVERRKASIAHHLIQSRFKKLTEREREVVELVVSGMTNKQIACRFGISSQAVDAARGRAMDKLEVESVSALVRVALEERGWGVGAKGE